MRRIKFRDEEIGKILIFLTNNFHLEAIEIALLYKYRWDIELFLKCLPAGKDRNKTTFENQILLWTIGKCSENPSVDCRICLCFDWHCKEEIYDRTDTLRNFTSFKHLYF